MRQWCQLRRIACLVAEMRPTGSVPEIACVTGLWTEALARWADMVTAVDAAPEAVAIARDRVRSANVSFEVDDVFSLDPGTRFDVIFFSAWLSHVPASRTPAAPARMGLHDPPGRQRLGIWRGASCEVARWATMSSLSAHGGIRQP